MMKHFVRKRSKLTKPKINVIRNDSSASCATNLETHMLTHTYARTCYIIYQVGLHTETFYDFILGSSYKIE